MISQYVIVGGTAYTDIDVLACASAYKQFQQLQGRAAMALISPVWNQTIPSSVKKWTIEVDHIKDLQKDRCGFIVVDVSDPKFLADFVDKKNILEVYDHHFGFESYWKEQIQENAHIEKVGACATLIWEQFKKYDLHHKISNVNANLLYTAIFANTLDFKSKMTHQRDIEAYEEIGQFTTVSKKWKNEYYEEVQKGILSDLTNSLLTDMKVVNVQGKNVQFGQIELWSAAELCNGNHGWFDSLVSGSDIIVNAVSIDEGKSYIFTNSASLREKLQLITHAETGNGNALVTQHLWQRKELLRELLHIFLTAG